MCFYSCLTLCLYILSLCIVSCWTMPVPENCKLYTRYSSQREDLPAWFQDIEEDEHKRQHLELRETSCPWHLACIYMYDITYYQGWEQIVTKTSGIMVYTQNRIIKMLINSLLLCGSSKFNTIKKRPWPWVIIWHHSYFALSKYDFSFFLRQSSSLYCMSVIDML